MTFHATRLMSFHMVCRTFHSWIPIISRTASVLLTFGLLSPNKGIENVIRALPTILAKHANLVYIVSGATHPHIRRREGERYREELQALAEECGVSSHVIFNNRFVSAEALVE